MNNYIDINEQLVYSKQLWEKHKDSWLPMSPEYGKEFILFMIEEIGEVIALIKKKGEDEIVNDLETRRRFVEEMCDVMMYHTDILNRFRITAEEYSTVYRAKYNKNMTRNFKKDHQDS